MDLTIKADKLLHNSEIGFYEGLVTISKTVDYSHVLSHSIGKILLNPEKNILSLIILSETNKPESKITINSLSPSDSLEYLNKITLNGYVNEEKGIDQSLNSDANIRVNSNLNGVYMQFVGKNGMSKGDERRFSFRAGIKQVAGRSPVMATMNFTPTKYSHGGGISVYDVYPKSRGGISVNVPYNFGIITVGYSIARSMYSVGSNSATSYVSVDIINGSEAYWTGSNTSKSGLAADFYLKMLSGGTSGSCMGYNVNTSFEVVDTGLGHTFTVKGPSTNSCMTLN